MIITREYILKTLKTHKDELTAYGVRAIGLFGSYLRDEQGFESDIDLLVDFYPESENFDNLMSVYDFLQDLFKDKKIELVTVNGLSPFVGPSILKEAEYV